MSSPFAAGVSLTIIVPPPVGKPVVEVKVILVPAPPVPLASSSKAPFKVVV